jgi:hypothetical protein
MTTDYWDTPRCPGCPTPPPPTESPDEFIDWSESHTCLSRPAASAA